jgi:DNA-binding NarL/FixJ family response regulator
VLTKREMEVLLLAAQGSSNRQKASSLNLSEKTVKRHLANTYEKMGVSTPSTSGSPTCANLLTILRTTSVFPGGIVRSGSSLS